MMMLVCWQQISGDLFLQKFEGNQCRKTITVHIIPDNQYKANMDFSVVLHHPSDHFGVGDPSVATVIITDDDGMYVYVFMFVCLFGH